MAFDPIRPKDLPAAPTVYASDSIAVDNGSTVLKATPVQIVDAGAPVASQAEALAGVDATKRMTPLTVKQAIDVVVRSSTFSTRQLALDAGLVSPVNIAWVQQQTNGLVPLVRDATQGIFTDILGAKWHYGRVAFPQGELGGALRITKQTAPANYSLTRASLVVEHTEDYGGLTVANGTKIDDVLFVFTDTAQGVTTSSTNSSVITGQGIRAFYSKEGDGSGQCFTASMSLGPNGVNKGTAGANGYNEGGAFQALMTNIGSTNGYMSGVEMHLRDSPDDGATSFATRLTGGAFGIKKYNASALAAYSLHVLNEGTGAGAKDLDAIIYADPRVTTATWKRGIDLYGDGTWDFSTLIAMQMREGNKLRWTDGTNHTQIYANSNSHIILEPGTAAAQIYSNNTGTLAAPAWSFVGRVGNGLYSPSASAIGLVAGGVEGLRVLSNNIQISIAGGALKTVTEGAVDSGGVGFKLLRVPNT